MLCAILNKSWKQHPTKQQLCGHLPPITKTIQVSVRYAEHCKRNEDELKRHSAMDAPVLVDQQKLTFIRSMDAI